MNLSMGIRAGIFLLVPVMCAALGAGPAEADRQRYSYDEAGRLIRVVDEDGQRVEYLYDEAGNLMKEIRSGTRSAVRVCADLSHPKKDSFPDTDVYTFEGRAGELVTVAVMADPPERGMGLKAALTLRDRTPRQAQNVTDVSVLPNELSLILEQDGTYEVTIHGQRQVFQDLRYSGPYCVTLQGLPETAASLTGP